jgi:hypothetical protein
LLNVNGRRGASSSSGPMRAKWHSSAPGRDAVIDRLLSRAAVMLVRGALLLLLCFRAEYGKQRYRWRTLQQNLFQG